MVTLQYDHITTQLFDSQISCCTCCVIVSFPCYLVVLIVDHLRTHVDSTSRMCFRLMMHMNKCGDLQRSVLLSKVEEQSKKEILEKRGCFPYQLAGSWPSLLGIIPLLITGPPPYSIGGGHMANLD